MKKPFFWAPGYSVFLGLLMRVSESIAWLKATQVALGTASCALVGMLAARLFQDARVTLFSVAIAALVFVLAFFVTTRYRLALSTRATPKPISELRTHDATNQLRRVLTQVASSRVHMTVCMMAKRAKLDLRPDCR